MKIYLESLDKAAYSEFSKSIRGAPGAAGFLPFARSRGHSDSMIDKVSGAHLFGTKPSDAPFAFHLIVFPGLQQEQIARYQRERNVSIPKQMQRLYLRFNGLRFGRLCVYGLRNSAFQPMPNADAAYVPVDVYIELEDARRRRTPYIDRFPVGSVLLATEKFAHLVLTENAAVDLIESTGEVIRKYDSLDLAIRGEASLIAENAA